MTSTTLLVQPTRPVTLGDRIGAGLEQSASTDQGCLVRVDFLAADKGPSVSAVIQLTS